jgi:hypothetical protein
VPKFKVEAFFKIYDLRCCAFVMVRNSAFRWKKLKGKVATPAVHDCLFDIFVAAETKIA